MRITTGQALTSLCPTADFSASEENDGTNVQIYWHDKEQTQPTDTEIQAEIVRLQAEYDNNKYQRDRQPNYPPITDYLDGIVKGDQAQIDKYIADCLAVKQRYPKNDGGDK